MNGMLKGFCPPKLSPDGFSSDNGINFTFRDHEKTWFGGHIAGFQFQLTHRVLVSLRPSISSSVKCE